MRSNTLVGIVAGIVVGVVLDAVILLLINKWLLILIWPMVLPIIIGVGVGVRVMRRVPDLHKSMSAAIILVLICLGFFGISKPEQYVHNQLVRVADTLPIPPGAELRTRTVVEGCSDNSEPWVSSEYVVDGLQDEVVKYIEKGLSEEWNKSPDSKERIYRKEIYSVLGDKRLVIETSPLLFSASTSLSVHVDVYKYCGRNSRNALKTQGI